MRLLPNHLFKLNRKGQASILVLALVGVILLCTVFLYQSGRITSEKMQLQNAADAAAYSAMTLEARSLNFAAYTNRAMVANEVAVGQLIGMLSWVDQMTQAEEYADVYTSAIEVVGQALAAVLIETVGGAVVVEALTDFITAAIDTIAGVVTAVGEVIEVVLDVVVSPTVAGLSLVNEAYSVSQKIYHVATYGAVVKGVYQSLEDNVPGTHFGKKDLLKKKLSGAQLSDLGVVALVGHVPSFWSGYTKVYSTSAKAKSKKKKADKKADKKDDKSDGKSDGKKKKKKVRKKKKKSKFKNNATGMGRFAAMVRDSRDPFSSGVGEPSRNWSLELGFKKYVDVPLIGKVGGGVALGAESCGASELRYINREVGSAFDWSAVDSSAMVLKFNICGKWKGVGAPFGAAGFQAPQTEETALLPENILPSFPELLYGKRKAEPYGGAGSSSHLLAWPGVIKEMEEDQVETYKGLRPYRDMAGLKSKELYPFQAPFFLVGVTRKLDDVTGTGPQFVGHLDLTEYDSKTNVDSLGAIAKAELYFCRPAKLSYFARKDKKKENSNVFNPFWQARLVDASNADRMLALALQQKVLWLTEEEKNLIGGNTVDEITSAVASLLQGATGVISRLLELFL